MRVPISIVRDESHIPDEEFKKIVVAYLHEIVMTDEEIAGYGARIAASLGRIEKNLRVIAKTFK